MKLLLTAFDPFGGEQINPALEALKLVANKIGNVEVVKQEVPTVFGKSIKTVQDAIERERPDAVLCVGQAGGRFDITVEKVAINYDDARIKDNEGNQPLDHCIFEDGDTAYFATLPIKAMVAEIRKVGVPASISYSAGTFVCNHLMYGTLYTLTKKYPGVIGGFVHVPYTTEQVLDKRNMPSLTIEQIVKAIEAAIKVIGENVVDLNSVEGAIY